METKEAKPGKRVYFLALADIRDKSSSFLCTGYIIQSVKDAPWLRKVIVESVNPILALIGLKADGRAAELIGRKITKNHKELWPNLTSIPGIVFLQAAKLEETQWLQPTQKNREYINTYLKSKGLSPR